MCNSNRMVDKRIDQNNMCGKKDPLNSKSNGSMPEITKPTSLRTLITWNISKVLEKNPSMDIKVAIKAAQTRLEHERDMSAMIPDSFEQRHLACAILAWQQLGHSDMDSLCQFIENKINYQECSSALSDVSFLEEMTTVHSQTSTYSKGQIQSMSFGSRSIGPVIKLPVETKIVMRIDSSPSARQTAKSTKAPEKETIKKIKAACCLDSVCTECLTKMDTATSELRMRAGMLAKREAERVELLERAEIAWRDLELGYQRRLMLAEEKEIDLTKQIQKAIEERNGYKDVGTSLATQLKEKGDKAEKDRAALSLVEKDVCERACLRLKLSEEAAQGEAVLTEHQCRAAQLDRDLQFKEEQASRKLQNFQSELESSRTITHETERAMRAELSALREQIAEVSERLLGEDSENARIKNELEDLRQEKMEMVEDLEGCKVMCDSRMQGKTDELKKKSDQLAALKDKVTECRCKLPVDATIEVKRTASLAALCRCTPEDKIMDSCSCTSLRGRLLSNMLGDLFSGLQAELDGTGTQMPCQLLKCLEDKHNWDRSSIVKTNLKNYFSQLLIGELDIAVATSIEKYHAKWVGQSCADTTKMIPEPGEAENEGWQERAIERRAHKLATKLAEQLFQDRADELTQRAKEIVSSGPPPCECASKPQQMKAYSKESTTMYPMLVRPKSPAPANGPTTPAKTPAYWRQTMHDVTQLRVQIEDLKKDSIKKEDLQLMEEKITNIFQRGSVSKCNILAYKKRYLKGLLSHEPKSQVIGKADIRGDALANSNSAYDTIVKKVQKINRAVNSNLTNYNMDLGKPISSKKKQMESNSSIKKGQKPYIIDCNGPNKTLKPIKKLGQTYAIHMCMCSQRYPKKIVQSKNPNNSDNEESKGGFRKDRSSKDSILISSSVKQTKPINSSFNSQDISTRSSSKSSGQQPCQSNCKCFHKVPSNTSIDKLLETLAKWKLDLYPRKTEKASENEIPCCNLLTGVERNELNNKNKMQNDLSMPICCTKSTCISSVATIQKVNKVSDIEEESINKSKITPRTSDFVELTKPKKSTQSSYGDKQSSINTENNTSTTSEIDEEKNKKDVNNNRNTTANDDASLKVYASNMGKDKSNLRNCVSRDCKPKPLNMDADYIVPETTASVYMGAINLDKSNDDFCRCVNFNERTSNPPNEPLQGMPCQCSGQSLTTKTKKKLKDNEADMSIGEARQQKNSQMKTNDTQRNSSPAMLKSLQGKSDDCKKIEKEIFPCDCGYDIQFLGVTLTDLNSEKDEKEEELKTSNIGVSDVSLKNAEKEEEFKTSNIGISDVSLKNVEKEEGLKANHICVKNKTNTKKNIIQYLNINKVERKEFPTNLKQQASNTNIKQNIIEEAKVDNKDNNIKDDKKSCETECQENFNEFKNFICDAFQIQQTNDDKGLDVQSFIETKSEEESCVCCDKQKGDNSKDLEENTFHLLEEHLKNKLEEFKEASCNSTCIPVEEEEKLFSTILKRVKKIIRESTNQIACKCSNEQANSGGSWKRAYGLLHEYLKTKIKRVQCSCVLAEDNKDTILPEVLEKVCNLIEHDFQRLKDVCSCEKSKLQDNKDSKSVYFEEEVPERDTVFFNIKNNLAQKTMNSQNPQTLAIIKENISSQVPASLGMETKSCNVNSETNTKDVQTLEKAQESLKSLDTTQDCYSSDKKADAELLGTNGIEVEKLTESSSKNYESKMHCAQFSHIPHVRYASECICKGNECANYTIPVIVNDNTAFVNEVQKPIPDKNGNENRTSINKAAAELLGITETKTGQLSVSAQNYRMCKPTNSSPYCQKNTYSKTNDSITENVVHFHDKPYIGFTIDCSCDTALGACVCTKSTFQAASGVMDSIMKKSMPNDKYYEKVSYILKSNPTENTNNYNSNLLAEINGDLYLHNVLKHKTSYVDDSKQDCETEASIGEEGDMVLKSSREYLEMADTKTNTIGDNMSLDTEASHDWCECCSQMPVHSNLNRDHFKHSTHFPLPLGNLNSDIEKHNSESVPKALPKHCNCDMVPICHVKMLVEQIEDNLVSAKCTCDSMIPKVCPIHSTRC